VCDDGNCTSLPHINNNSSGGGSGDGRVPYPSTIADVAVVGCIVSHMINSIAEDGQLTGEQGIISLPLFLSLLSSPLTSYLMLLSLSVGLATLAVAIYSHEPGNSKPAAVTLFAAIICVSVMITDA
jgi:hypothetical protein